MKKVILFTAIFTLLITLASISNILAVNYEISGNGAGSSSNVTVNQQNSTNVNQNNQSNISNDVDSNCTTGGNSASGNTGGNVGVNTGDCSSNVNITNQTNTNNANINCPTCPKPSPTPKPGSSPVPGQPGADGGEADGVGGASSSASNPEVLGQAGASQNLALMLGGMSLIFAGLFQTKRALAIF